MQFEKIYFQKSYQVGEFLYEHYGCGILVGENENPVDAMKAAEDFVKEHHFTKYKEMYEQMGSKTINLHGEITTSGEKKPMDVIIQSIYENAILKGDTDTIEKIKAEYNVEVV